MNKHKISELCKFANQIRRTTLEMIHASHASHIASAFSIAELLAVLYGNTLNISPKTVKDLDRDRFVLSKGHAAAAVYAALYLKGFILKSDIEKYYCDGAILSGHVSHKNVNGIEISTGSLGHGVCVACGIALAGKLDKNNYKTYTIVGDGECDEGCVWEMAMFASQQKLKNLTVIVDKNQMQAMGETRKIMANENLASRFENFGFHVMEVDGHDVEAISDSLSECEKTNRPSCIIAHTVKGKGVSFMENNILWHYRDPQGELYQRAEKELNDEKTFD